MLGNMKVVGLLRVRNEELIIKEALDSLDFVDEIYVYDDASTDQTQLICMKHPKVAKVIRNKTWKIVKGYAPQGEQLQQLLEIARSEASPDWFITIDADERFDEDFLADYPKLLKQRNYDAIVFELYDFYITKEDYNKPYNGDLSSLRKYCGTEYRNTLIMFRNLLEINFPKGVYREPGPFDRNRVLFSRYKIRHYGKAISVENFEKKLSFYIKYRPQYRDKCEKRRGKAIHETSDFGTKLVTWEQLKANPELRGLCLYSYNNFKGRMQPFKKVVRYVRRNFRPLDMLIRRMKGN
jgi:glycosyltransferase involved in cell wall biosynthesis